VRFRIARLAFWAPGVREESDWAAWRAGGLPFDAEGEPDLLQMPPLLRRRAGRLLRMACDVAYRALGDAKDVPTIFGSRYGDSERAFAILSDLAEGRTLSPASFSLSVHNATGGLFSMARRDTASSIAVAAGEATAESAMIEACGVLAEGAPRALVVCTDCALTDVYARYADVAPATYAWAALIEPAASDAGMCIAWEWTPEADAVEQPLPAGLKAMRFLQSEAPEFAHVAGGLRWRWSRRG
jgi:hypothetical protein